MEEDIDLEVEFCPEFCIKCQIKQDMFLASKYTILLLYSKLAQKLQNHLVLSISLASCNLVDFSVSAIIRKFNFVNKSNQNLKFFVFLYWGRLVSSFRSSHPEVLSLQRSQ